MNLSLKSTQDFLWSVQMRESSVSEEAEFFIVWILDEEGLIERCLWLNPNSSLNTQAGENLLYADSDMMAAGELIADIIERIRNQKGVIEFVSFVGTDGKIKRIIAERVRDRLNLVVFGAGHVGRSVAQLGAIAGYKVVVVDDREEVLSYGNMASIGVQVLQADYDAGIDHLYISSDTAVVIVTRGHQYDELCLRYVLGSSAFYIGMIGSKRRVLSIFRTLELEGFAVERLKSVFAPIGLRIGAVSPQEIAIAIMAEIICCARGGDLEEKCHLKV